MTGGFFPLRLLKQSRLIGHTCLSDANPNKSAAVGGHSLRCLRVLAQTCLMSRSADIYSAAVGSICIKRERTAAATSSAHTACGPEQNQARSEHRPTPFCEDFSGEIQERVNHLPLEAFKTGIWLNFLVGFELKKEKKTLSAHSKMWKNGRYF